MDAKMDLSQAVADGPTRLGDLRAVRGFLGRAFLTLTVLLTACGSANTRPTTVPRSQSPLAQELVIYSMSLLDTGYRFGGKNPAAGIDCSGMVSYVYQNATQMTLTGSAANIARQGQRVPKADLQPADLVFFNTRGGRYTHVGIYIGDGRFIHAPSSASGGVRISRLDEAYFAKRFTEARSYLD